MASRGPFDIFGARAGAWPRGSWQGDTRDRRGSSAATRDCSGRGKVKDGMALGGGFISASLGVFPLGGGGLAGSALTPARTRGWRGGEGSAGPQE